ncbi:MAG: hypothetical protein K2P81_06210 [Bacteriovoracaceae bacterium]|nr:hypothetical protein [Bacteriovoracaceae bacterium]
MSSEARANQEALHSEDSEALKIRHKERQLKLLKSKEHKPSDYFYQVGNPMELAKIGQSYLEDFKNGVKSFAVTSTDYKSSQQRTVLALACYFDHLFDMKILIISDTLNMGMFVDVMNEATKEDVQVKNSTRTVKVNHFGEHFDLIDLDDLIHLNSKEKPNFEFERAMKSLLDSYDIVFWDSPTLNTFKNKSFTYRQALSFIESLTIIISQAASNSKDVSELKEYFSGFGVNIKGVVFDKLQVEKPVKKSKWWGGFAF